MAKMKKGLINERAKQEDEEKATSGMQQVYLSMNGDHLPGIAVRPVESKSYPANLALLRGVVVDMPGECKEDDAWNIINRISDLVRLGNDAENTMGKRNAACEHLAYAYSILCDYLKEFDGDYTMSKETAETLIRGAIDRLNWLGQCIGCEIENYRSEDN